MTTLDRPAARAGQAMRGSEVPQSLLSTWPSTRADAWEQLSEHRWRAPHTTPGFVWCVVVCFGETLGRPAKREDEMAAFAELFEAAGRIGAHRVACQNGTPVVRPADEANAGVVGVCWWCGKRPDEHGDGAE